MPTRVLCCAALLPVALSAQALTFAEGVPGSLAVVTVAEAFPNGVARTVLHGVELLPIEITGRTLGQEHDPGRARRVERHGIARVELPGGGRVFRYRRGAGQAWGFLHVDATGAARVVLERPGTGAALADPFADRIAVDADGMHAAVALVAGGLVLVRLDGGTFASTARADRLVQPGALLEEQSVLVGAGTVYFQDENHRLWRCAVADGNTPVDITPPPVPNGELEDQMALARDGSVLVFLYGPDDLQRLWRAGPTGTASVLPPPPDDYEDPGYLPEGAGEPALLLADDGSRLLYVDSDPRDELWLLDLAGVLPPLQITADHHFQPYIGGHILPRFHGPRLAVAIGDVAAMDWFAVDLANGGSVANLTNTGTPLPPFASGVLDPADGLTAGGTLLVTDRQPAGLTLRRVDPLAGGLATLEHGLLGPAVPGAALAGAGAADVLVRTTAGERLYAGTTGALFAPLPPGLALTPPVHGHGFAATWLHLANGWGSVCLYRHDGSLATGPFEQGVTQLTATAAGGLVVVGNPVRYFAPGVSLVLNRPAAAVRLCLSGAGG